MQKDTRLVHYEVEQYGEILHDSDNAKLMEKKVIVYKGAICAKNCCGGSLTAIMQDVSRSVTYDVFLVHCDSDRGTAEYIDNILSKAGFKCIASFKDNLFPPGRDICDNIKNAIKSSKVTLVLLTKESRNSSWVTYETILALEKSQRLGQLCIRLLLHGVERSDEKELKVGILDDLPHLFIDVASSDWDEKLVQHIKEPLPVLSAILPAGSLALGQVYNVVTGFYGNVLPDLKKAMMESQLWVPNRTSVKLFILLPDDCKTYAVISEYESRVQHVGKVLVIKTIHVGKPRLYSVDVYSISDGAEKYYFAAEYPHVLKTMFMIKDIAKVDLRLQMTRFYHTLRKVLTHSKHRDCHNTYNVIDYHANAEEKPEQSLYNLVLKHIKAELTSGQKDVLAPATFLPTAEDRDSKIKDATITVCEEIKEDREIASKIEMALGKHNLTISRGGSKFKHMCGGKWKIFVLSKEALRDHFLEFAFSSARKESIDQNRLCVIPVLHGMEIREVPDFIKWVTYLSADEEGYEERLVQTMKGKEMTMETKLPAGDVATGLAWGYVLSYLPIPLLGLSQDNADLTQRIKNKLKEQCLNAACIKRLYITIPKTCRNTPIETKEDQNADPLIVNLGQLETVKFTSAGTVDRPYQLVMFKMTSEQKLPGEHRNICFLAEQATPTYTLLSMSKLYGDAGLSQEDLMEQVENFGELCTKLVADKNVKKMVAHTYQDQAVVADIEGLCKFVHSDDDSHSVAKCLEEEIRRDLSSLIESGVQSGVELVSL